MSQCTKPEQEERGRNDSLTDLIRGGRKLIAQALKAEVAELVGTYTHLQDGRGHAVVVLATGSARAGDSEGD